MSPKRTASLSDTLHAIIADRGLSAGAVATEAKVAPSVFSRFIARERELTTGTLDAIAEALDLRLVEGRGGLQRSRRSRAGWVFGYHRARSIGDDLTFGDSTVLCTLFLF